MQALIKLLFFAAGIYLLLALALYFLQSKMVFLADMPGRALEATPADFGLAYENVRLATRDGETIHGWYVPSENPRGVVLFFHGNAGNISHRLDSIRIFRQLELDVLIIDYRGYGESSGKPSEKGTYLDAEAAWDYLRKERGLPAGRIVIFGRSLGGAIGSELASRQSPAAVIIESSFSSGPDMAKRLYPFLPANLITRLRYPVTDYAAQIESPVLVIHSRDDEIIPFEMGRAIYDAVSAPKDFVELRGDHNSGFFVSLNIYQAGLSGFLDSVFGRSP